MQCQRFGQIPVDQSENIAFAAFLRPSAVVTSLGIDREHSGRRRRDALARHHCEHTLGKVHTTTHSGPLEVY